MSTRRFGQACGMKKAIYQKYPSPSLLGLPIPVYAGKSVNILIELAVAMRKHGRGALILITPANNSNWIKSIVQPIGYRLNPAYALLPDNLEEDSYLHKESEAHLRRAINSIGGFSAVDGATVISSDHKLLAFGAKVARSDVGLPLAQVLLSEPIKNGKPELLDSTKIGGTRHLAAAQFVHDQRDAIRRPSVIKTSLIPRKSLTKFLIPSHIITITCSVLALHSSAINMHFFRYVCAFLAKTTET